ncbi:MAG: sulfatase [Myxococcota bacterium]
MNRVPLVATVVGLLALLIALVVGLAGSSSADRPPNVLVILWDTVRADRLSLYGYERSTTPRMAAWAEAHGVVFDQAVSPAMWTVPSHASLFTGLPPSTHGAGFDHRWLDDERITLAEHFADHGYDTFAFSANPNLHPSRVNLLQGFQTIETSWGRRWRKRVVQHTRDKMIPRDRSTEVSPRRRGAKKHPGYYNAGPVARDALISHLVERENKDQPFLAYLSYMEAHKPRLPRMASRRAVTDDETVELGLETDMTFDRQLAYSHGKAPMTAEELDAVNRVYDASLRELDEATADLLEDLQARGVLDDTIVVFTADHGEQLGEHNQFGHRHGVYQSLLHVPLVIAYPKTLTPRRVRHPVSNLAVFDTLLELTGLPKPSSGYLPGNLLSAASAAAPVFAETISIDRLGFRRIKRRFPDLEPSDWSTMFRTVVEGSTKLIQHLDFETHEVMGHELYDLEADPHETTDLAEQRPDDVKRLAQVVTAWHGALEPWTPPEDDGTAEAEVEVEPLSKAECEQLELLGYVDEGCAARSEGQAAP